MRTMNKVDDTGMRNVTERARKWLASIVIGLALAAPQAQANAAKLPPEWNALVRMYDSTMQQDNAVGASVALVEHGHIVARHDFGLADRSTGKPVDGDTI